MTVLWEFEEKYRRPPCTQSDISLLTMLSCGFIAFPREIESA
jgi:hypothetical protein